MAMRVTLARDEETTMTTPTSRLRSCRAATSVYARERYIRRIAWRTLHTRIATFIRNLLDERRTRQARGDLESMSDRDLRDIGLRRTGTDVAFALRRERPSLELVHFDRD